MVPSSLVRGRGDQRAAWYQDYGISSLVRGRGGSEGWYQDYGIVRGRGGSEGCMVPRLWYRSGEGGFRGLHGTKTMV